jgi:alanine dehydrogenase
LVEAAAGEGFGFVDSAYSDAGAETLEGPVAVFESAELIVKVK